MHTHVGYADLALRDAKSSFPFAFDASRFHHNDSSRFLRNRSLLRPEMNTRGLSGFSVLQPNAITETAEAQLAYAVVATDISPATANPTTKDIRRAILEQFESEVTPVAITRFRSDFVIQFDNQEERDIFASSMVLKGRDFSALLVTWSNKYGAKVVDWQTEVAIDITGFPPHAFNPSALGPLLEHHCSIQAYGFNKAKGVCRVDGYALSTRSIPKNGELAFQYPTAHGVRNVVFPAALQTYPYSEAPEFQPDGYPADPDHSTATFDTAEELGYDREVLQEAYEEQHRANQALEGVSPTDSESSSDSYYEGMPYQLRDCSPARSFESDRSWHLY